MIYLVSPYSHEDPNIRAFRYQHAVHYAGMQMQKGEIIFSPIAYGHQFALRGHRGDHLFWEEFNSIIMKKSNEFRVLQLPGWEESKGVQAELAYAKEHGKAIRYVKAAVRG